MEPRPPRRSGRGLGVRDRLRRRPGHHLQHRSRALAARPCRAAGGQLPEARVPHRQASRCGCFTGRVRAGAGPDRRPLARRPALLHCRPHHGRRAVVVDLHAASSSSRRVEIRDWQMLVETWPDGRHNFPKFTRESRSEGPRRFVTTVRIVRAVGGTFTLEDHGAPWGITAPNLDVVISKLDTYRGTAAFDQATIRIAQLRADVGADEEPLQDRRRQGRLRSDRPRHRWRAPRR